MAGNQPAAAAAAGNGGQNPPHALGGGADYDLWRLPQNNPFASVAVVVLHILLYALIAVMCAFHDVVCKMAPVLGLAVPFVVCILVVLSCTVKTCCAHLTAA